MTTPTTTMFTLEGRRGAPLLVLANSLGATSEMWAAQVPIWREHFQVLRYDYPGHGGSAAPAGALCIEDLASDLLCLLDDLRIERFSFAGVSLGGMLGLHLAATQPARVQRLVAANFRYCQTDATREQWDQRIALTLDQGVDAIADGTADRWLTPDYRTRHPEQDAAIRAMIRSTSSAGYAACAAAVRDYDARPWLARIETPTLLISGAADVAAPADHIAELAASLPTSRLLSLPAAHLSNIECANAFANAVREFIAPDAAPAAKVTA